MARRVPDEDVGVPRSRGPPRARPEHAAPSVVIASREGDADVDADRGSLEVFLSECVADARERGEVMALDALLSKARAASG